MLGKKLKLLRAEKDMSQDALADYMGVRRNTISNWENEVSNPDNEQLLKLSSFFGVSTDTLLGKQPSGQKPESKPNYILATERHLRINYKVAQLNENEDKDELDFIEKALDMALERKRAKK